MNKIISNILREGICMLLFLGTVSPVHAYAELFNQTGGGSPVYQSSESGTDLDAYVWDDFTVPSDASLYEIHWRGGYDAVKNIQNQGLPVTDFKMELYGSLPGGFQPDLGAGALYTYGYGIGTAGETYVGSVGGNDVYDYSYVLPAGIPLVSGTTYWIKITALLPDTTPAWWGLSAGSGGNTIGFEFSHCESCSQYRQNRKDLSFSLYGTPAEPQAVPEFGLISGLFAGLIPVGSYLFLKKRTSY